MACFARHEHSTPLLIEMILILSIYSIVIVYIKYKPFWVSIIYKMNHLNIPHFLNFARAKQLANWPLPSPRPPISTCSPPRGGPGVEFANCIQAKVKSGRSY